MTINWRRRRRSSFISSLHGIAFALDDHGLQRVTILVILIISIVSRSRRLSTDRGSNKFTRRRRSKEEDEDRSV